MTISSPSFFRRIWRVLDERLSLSGLAYAIPEHGNTLPFLLGGTAVTLFIVQALTGILLAQFYNPFPVTEPKAQAGFFPHNPNWPLAYASIWHIVNEVPFGAFLRSLHFWTANGIVVVLGLHLIRNYITATYKRPRELQWMIGVLAGIIGLLFVFTGTMLKWDQEGLEALEHNVEIGEFVGALGYWFSPEFAVSIPLTVRVYVAHIAILPLLIVPLLLTHFYLIKRFGLSTPFWIRTFTAKMLPFTSHLKRLLLLGAAVFAILAVLSLAVAAPLGQPPVEGIEVTKPLWPFLWIFAIEDFLGISGIFYGSIALFIGLMIVPLLDRSSEVHPRKRMFMMGLLIGVIILWIVLSIYGLIAPHQVLSEHPG